MTRPPRNSGTRHDSGQKAADGVLHLKQFGLPPKRFTPAQPRLGCCPPRTAAPAGEYHARPGLDDLAERPQVPGRSRPVQRLVQFLLEPAPVASASASAHQFDPLRRVRAVHPFGHAHYPPPRRPNRSSAQEYGSAFGHLVPRWSASSWTRTPALWRPLGTVASTHGTLPHRRAMLHQGAVLSSDDYGWRVERTARFHPLWQAP